MGYTVRAKNRRTSSDTASVIHVSLTDHVACACDGDAECGAQDKGWGECAGMEFCGRKDGTDDYKYIQLVYIHI